MQSKASSVEQYIDELPQERKVAIGKIRETILKNIPQGFAEIMSYGMIGYAVPHSIYKSGYRSDPKMPLPFINLASQKNFIAFYHMGIYANPELHDWFINEYAKQCKTKLDMGKGCIRFKKMDDIPFKLIGELVSKISVEKWIKIYESNYKK